jgi:flagellar basal body-associated protein FliL
MAKTLSKAKTAAQDYSIVYAVGIALFCLILGFVLVSSGLRHSQRVKSTVAYAHLEPVLVRVQGYAFSASIAIQTSAGDAKWAARNRHTLSDLFQTEMAKANPQQLRAPNGLLPLQETLKQAANTALHTEQVQNVLITDFLMEAEDR